MATTFQQLCDRARYTLKDDDKIRYPDAELLVYANVLLSQVKRQRPDLFFGTYSIPLVQYALADTYPLDPEYEQPMIDYLIGRAEAKNGEAGDDGRAVAFMGMATAGFK